MQTLRATTTARAARKCSGGVYQNRPRRRKAHTLGGWKPAGNLGSAGRSPGRSNLVQTRQYSRHYMPVCRWCPGSRQNALVHIIDRRQERRALDPSLSSVQPPRSLCGAPKTTAPNMVSPSFSTLKHVPAGPSYVGVIAPREREMETEKRPSQAYSCRKKHSGSSGQLRKRIADPSGS